VADDGAVGIVIYNPTRDGVTYTANFSFYNSKGEYLTGFSVGGFASGGSRTGFSLQLPDYREFRRASLMKVLGRAGRTVEGAD
jgi:hypothetical protein